MRLEPSDVARKIKQIEADDANLRGRYIHRVGDPAIWGTQGAESIGALMERERVYFDKGDNARISGKMQVHHRLAFDERGIPSLYVFNTCANFIRTVPALCYDTSDVEDIDTDMEDHIYDMLRYVCMANPIPARQHHKPKAKIYSPLDTEDNYKDKYAWYAR